MAKLIDNSKFQFSVFILIFLIALTPVLGFKFFPTVDGPAHLYNARILREFFFGYSDFYSQFYIFNSTLVPNLSGHLFAVVAGLFLPLWMTEKLIVLFITCFFPLSIFYLAKAYTHKLEWHSLLILPFIYTITLYLGFFNFMIGLPVMFFVLAWVKNSNNELSKLGYLVLFLLLTVIYFSHLMIFGLTLFLVVMQVFWMNKIHGSLNKILPEILKLLFVFIPGLVFSVMFLSQRSLGGFKNKVESYSLEELWRMFYEGSPLVGISGPDEVASSSLFMIVLSILFIVILYLRIKGKQKLQLADFFLIASIFMLVCYFVIPDGIASGGFLSLRFLLMFLICLVLWIIVHPLPKIISVMAALLAVFVSFSTLKFRIEVAKDLNFQAENMIQIADKMDSGTVLLPLNYSGNWLHTNLSNYIGAYKNIIVLDNYEAVTEAFPLQWHTKVQPYDLAGNFASSLNPSVSIQNYESKTGVKINYVTRWQYHLASHDSVSERTAMDLEKRFKGMEKIGEGDLFY